MTPLRLSRLRCAQILPRLELVLHRYKGHYRLVLTLGIETAKRRRRRNIASNYGYTSRYLVTIITKLTTGKRSPCLALKFEINNFFNHKIKSKKLPMKNVKTHILSITNGVKVNCQLGYVFRGLPLPGNTVDAPGEPSLYVFATSLRLYNIILSDLL